MSLLLESSQQTSFLLSSASTEALFFQLKALAT
jgi:hypothetical protein